MTRAHKQINKQTNKQTNRDGGSSYLDQMKTGGGSLYRLNKIQRDGGGSNKALTTIPTIFHLLAA